MNSQEIDCVFNECDCPSSAKRRGEIPTYSFRYVNESLKLIYYDIPKNASSTIRRMFFGETEAMSLLPPRYSLSEYCKITTCRNPYDRLVSNYAMFTQQPWRIPTMRQFVDNPEKLQFSDFVDIAIAFQNHHWASQSEYISNVDIDFTIRVEDFGKGLDHLNEKLGTQIQTKHLNKTFRDNYEKYYDNDSLKKVNAKYQEDFERFEYKMEQSL